MECRKWSNVTGSCGKEYRKWSDVTGSCRMEYRMWSDFTTKQSNSRVMIFAGGSQPYGKICPHCWTQGLPNCNCGNAGVASRQVDMQGVVVSTPILELDVFLYVSRILSLKTFCKRSKSERVPSISEGVSRTQHFDWLEEGAHVILQGGFSSQDHIINIRAAENEKRFVLKFHFISFQFHF